jgi:hypothetical protein
MSAFLPVRRSTDVASEWMLRATFDQFDDTGPMAGIGASRALPRIVATLCFLITVRAFSLSRRNWSSCHLAALEQYRHSRFVEFLRVLVCSLAQS